MRIIAGEFRSRRLKSLPGAATRPTPDRLRETLFDILQTGIAGTNETWPKSSSPVDVGAVAGT